MRQTVFLSSEYIIRSFGDLSFLPGVYDFLFQLLMVCRKGETLSSINKLAYSFRFCVFIVSKFLTWNLNKLWCLISSEQWVLWKLRKITFCCWRPWKGQQSLSYAHHTHKLVKTFCLRSLAFLLRYWETL